MTRKTLMIAAVLMFSIIASAHPVQAQCTPLTLTVRQQQRNRVSGEHADRRRRRDQLRHASSDDQCDSCNYPQWKCAGDLHQELPTAARADPTRKHQLRCAQCSGRLRGNGDEQQRRLGYRDGYGYVKTAAT